ncbi:MAG: hypothetical protein P4L91_14505 [Burkholderiaceae bacterium]|nr:hypothetical protein [Burkholderiaceae bacterium]
MKRKVKIAALIVFLLPFVYAFFFWNSLREIDNFCDSIDSTTKMSDLQGLAQRSGVELHGPMEMHGTSGVYIYAIAASGFTAGEYACGIHGESLSGTVTQKHRGY